MAADRMPWWTWLTTVRARTTLAAGAVVGLALLVGAAGLLIAIRAALLHNVEEVAELRAEGVSVLAREGRLSGNLGRRGEDDAFVMVTDEDARVVAASGSAPASSAGLRPPPGQKAITEQLVSGRPYHVTALRATSPEGPVVIYVAYSLHVVDETTAVVRRMLAVGLPLLLVFVLATAYVGVGRALRPVEAIRAKVADISVTALDRRVPAPRTHDEVGRLARTMNSMLDRLQAAADQQRQFVADAAHELRSPLAGSRAALEVALAEAKPDWRATVSAVLQEHRRMELLVADLLFLARGDAGAAPKPPMLVDLDDVVLLEAASLRLAARVPIDTTEVSAGYVLGRPRDLARVVRNLVENAERHARTAVRVRLSSGERDVTLVVEDDGPGIPADQRQRVFQRFARLDAARSREDGGTGLGLAIAQEIIAAHDGSIAVEDAKPGARLVVRLPVPG